MSFTLPWAIGIPLFVLLGLTMGSFATVLLERLPKNASIGGRSQCPHCHGTLRIFDLVPIFSYLWLLGKCRTCSARISPRYPLTELASAIIFTGAFLWTDGTLFAALGLAISAWALFVIVLFDAYTQLIPDALTLVAALGAATYRLQTTEWTLLLSAALVGLCVIGAQWLLSRGRWVGSGDVLLAGAIGLLMGSWEQMLVALFIAYILGGIVAAILLLKFGTKARGMKISFGPFLVMGGMVSFFFAEYFLQFFPPLV